MLDELAALAHGLASEHHQPGKGRLLGDVASPQGGEHELAQARLPDPLDGGIGEDTVGGAGVDLGHALALERAAAVGGIRGVAADVGCNNPGMTQDKVHMEVITELLAAVRAEHEAGRRGELAEWWTQLDAYRDTYPLGYTEPDPSVSAPARCVWDTARTAGGSSGGAAVAVAISTGLGARSHQVRM